MRRATNLHRYHNVLDIFAMTLGYGLMLTGVGWVVIALLRMIGVMQ